MMSAAAHRGIHIALFDEKRFEDIVLAPDDFFLRERILDRENRGQRLDFDAHRAARFFEQIFIGMREQDDGFLGMIYNAVGEAGLIVDDQRDAILVGNVFRGDDGEFIPRDAIAEMDAANPAARDRAANCRAVQHVRERDVVDVARAARHLLAALLFAARAFR